MTSQVAFTADTELKNKALEKAKHEGITLKTLFVYSMKAFVDGKIKLGIISDEEPMVEEVIFDSKTVDAKAKKLAKLLA